MHCGITVCRLGRVLVTTSFHDEAFLFPIGAQRVAQCNSKIQGLPQTKYVTFFSVFCVFLLNQTNFVIVQINICST